MLARSPSRFDAAIVGSGQAAPSLAVALAQAGETVALIEGHLIGGSCINVGCTPTKTLRKSARVAYLARRAAEFGVRLGSIEVDFGVAMARTHERVNTARAGLEQWLARQANLSVLRAWGGFVGRSTEGFELQVGDAGLVARRVYLNTGTRALIPPLARVGIGEAQAREQASAGRRILMATHAMKDVSRAKEESETIGLIKLLVDGESGRFLGATIFGIQGDEIIQVISNLMATGASYRVLKDALPVHPTVTEFLPTILGKLAPIES